MSPISFSSSFTQSLQNDEQCLLQYNLALQNGLSQQEAFNATMANASPSAQNFANALQLSENGIVSFGEQMQNFTMQQKQLEIAAMSQNRSFSNVSSILNTYNNGLKEIGLSNQQFIQGVSQGNSVLGRYLTNVGAGNATMKGYIGSLIAAKAATIGLRVAQTALNAVMGLGLGLIVQFVMSSVTKIFEAIAESFKSTDEKMSDLNTRFQDISSKAQETAKSFQQLKTSVSDIAPRFAELSKGVDSFGNNISLTDEEYAEFLKLNNQIAEMFPELNMGFDSNGNAMLALTGSAETLEQSLLNLVEAQRQLANEEIAKQIPDQIDALKDYDKLSEKTIADDEKRIKDYQEAKEDLQQRHSEQAISAAKKMYGDNWQSEMLLNDQTSLFATTAQSIWGSSEQDKAAWRAMIDGFISDDGLTIDWYKLLNSQEFQNRIVGIEKSINDLEQKTKEKWKSLASYINSWVQTDETYNNQNDQMQQVVSKMVSNLEYGTDKLDESEEIKKYIQDNILSPMQNASPEVQQAFSDMFNISTDNISIDEYISQIQQKAHEISRGSDFTYFEILKNTGFNSIIEEYKESANKIVDSLKDTYSGSTDDLRRKVNQLSPDELTKAFDYVEDYGIQTWDDLESALHDKTFEVVVDFDIEKEGFDNFLNAAKESITSTGLTGDSVEKLKSRYESLSNYDVNALFEKTADGIHLNTSALRELESEYEKQNKQDIDNKLKGLVDQYNKLTEEIYNETDAQKKALLYSQRANILDQINDTSTLAAQYEGLTSAFHKWEEAQSMGEEGDGYDKVAGSLENINKLYDDGLVGTNEFRAAVQLMSNEDLSTASIDDLVSAYESGYPIMTRYFTDSRDGCLNFLNDIQSLNSEWAHMNEDGSWDIDFGVGGDQKVAEALGINVESVQSIMRKLSDYGFDIHLDSVYSQLDGLQDRAREANQALIDIGTTEIQFNFDSKDLEDLDGQLSQAKELMGSLYDDKGELKVGYDEKDVENAAAIIERLIYQKQSLDDAAILKVDTSSADSGVAEVIAKLQNFKAAYNTLEVQTAVGADTTKAQTQCDSLLAEIAGMNPKILTALGIDTTSISTLNATVNSITPEMMVTAGLDDSLIEGYQATDHKATGTVTWNNNVTKVTSWIRQSHIATGTVKWTNDTTNVKTNFKASGKVSSSGTAKAQGTAYANGNWGTKSSGIALGGEIGQELIVRNGKFFTIGDDSAEFFAYKKNDIIFNAEQTRQILANGKITNGKKRGITYASGTAFSSGSGSFLGGNGSSNTSIGDSSSGKGNGSSSGNSSAKDDELDKVDWIEIAIDRIERAINKLKKTAESAYRSLKSRLTAANDEISKVNEEILLQQRAYDRYIQEANSVGLSSDLAEKVRNGTIDINKYNSDTRELISSYQEWYEKALACSESVDDLHESLASLYKDNFDNIQDDFDNQLSLLKHLTDTYDNRIDILKEKGYLESVQYYSDLQDVEQKNIVLLNKELESLEKSFADAMNSGEIEEYSDSWYAMQTGINDAKESIDKANLSLVKYSNTMREIKWDYFDYAQERISQITSETDFLIDLMSNSNLYQDNGQFNNEGMATMGLNAQNYNIYMAQANRYAKEILSIDNEIAKDPYNTDLIERREKLLELQQESISSAESEKKAIVDLVKDGIDIELESLKDLIDTYSDSLDGAKDLYDYQKKIEEQTGNISTLQKQLMAYENDTSEENRARVQQIRVDLAKAQEELTETEYDKFVSDTNKLLDNLYEEYETMLNKRLDDVNGLISDMIDTVNLNASDIKETIEKISSDVGYSITQNLNDILAGGNSANSIVSVYNNDFLDKLTSVNTVLNDIDSKISDMIGASNRNASNNSALNLHSIVESIAQQNIPLLSSAFNETPVPVFNNITDVSKMLTNIRCSNKGATNSIGEVNITIPIEHVENYNDFVRQLQNDSQFEQMIQAITTDRLAGKGALGKYKYHWN